MESPNKSITIMDKVDEIHNKVVEEIQKFKADLKQEMPRTTLSFARTLGIGEEIADRYVVEALLGHGTFSKMYLVKDKYNPIDGAQFALKVLSGSHEDNQRIVNNEIRVRSQVHNINIGSFIFADRLSSGDFVLVLEYIDGEIMRDWMKINAKQVKWDEFGEIIKQILLGLQYLHDNKFVHGDIRPESIIIQNKNNKVKIVDFGSSGIVGDAHHQLDGNKAYQSPDICAYGKKYPSQDTYAVGVILYEYLFGNNPFPKLISEEIQNNVPDKMLIDTKPIIKTIISKACSPILENRYKVAADMTKALKNAQLIK